MIKTYTKISPLKDAWQSLVDSKAGKIYLTYEFNKEVFRSYRYYKLVPFFYGGKKCIFVCNSSDDGSVKVIFPLLIDNKSREILLLGSDFGAGYNDIICNDKTSDKDIKEVFQWLKDNYGGYRINFYDLEMSSRLNSLYDVSFFRSCYAVDIKSYDEWQKSVSKNTRLNFNKVYNRTVTDGRKVEYFAVDKMSKKELFQIYKLYIKRLTAIKKADEKDGMTDSGFIWALKYYYRFICNPFFSALNRMERQRIIYLKIDGRLASFYSCFTEKDGIIIPRCAYEEAFARYSPGSILFAECIKDLCHGDPVKIDLSRDYHEYKVRYGCSEYPNNALSLTL